MAHVRADWVSEVTGGGAEGSTGDYVLNGASDDGFRTFGSALADGDTTEYSAADGSGAFETGVGTFDATGNAIKRTTVLNSSNADNPVNWGPGTKTIRIAPVAGMFARIAELPDDQTFTGLNTFEKRLRLVVDERAISWEQPGVSGSYNTLVKLGDAATWGSERAIVFTTAESRAAPVSETIVFTQIGMYVGAPTGLAMGAGSLNAEVLFEGGGRLLRQDEDLADVVSASQARDNLGLGNLAILDTVGSTQIASNAVGRSELKTDIGSVSLTTSGTDSDVATLPGGNWGFYPQFEINSSFDSGARGAIVSMGAGIHEIVDDDLYIRARSSLWPTSWTTLITLALDHAQPSGGRTVRARQRYIISSPPYDHGDGPVHGYVYVKMRGETVVVWSASDPPWYGAPENSPREYVKRDGKLMGVFRRPSLSLRDVTAGKVSLAEYKARCGEVEEVAEEITSEVKLRGMEKHPHPFVAAGEVVLLDPVCDITGRLLRQVRDGGDDIGELIAAGYLKVDNDKLEKRHGPPGVPIHACKWR